MWHVVMVILLINAGQCENTPLYEEHTGASDILVHDCMRKSHLAS